MKILFNTITRLEKGILLEYLFLVLVGIYDLFLMSTTSTFYLPYPDGFQKILFLVLLAIVLFKAILGISDLVKYGDGRNSIGRFLIGLWLGVVYFGVYKADRFIFLLFLGLITLGCIGINYRKLVKLHVILLALFLAVTCFCALGGAIENFVFMKDGSIRSSWGICYPTDFASAVFFLCLFTWTVLHRVPDILMLPIAVGGVWFARNIAMSITSTLCFSAFAGVLLLFALHDVFLRKCFCREVQDSNLFNCIKRILKWLLVMSFPLLGVTMFAMIYSYAMGYGFALIINNLISRRLELPLEMYRECGLKMFGTPFAQIGAGFSTYAAKDYNFVDSTYPLVLLRYGWVLFLSYCVIWPWTVYKAIRCGDWRLAWAITLIALHSFSEHHFIELNYNVLVAMPLASYRLTKKDSVVTEENRLSFRNQNNDSKKTAMIITGAAILIALWFLPEVLSRMRTITEMLGWYGGGRNGIKVIAVVTAGIGLCSELLYCIYQIVLHYDKEKNITAYRRWLIPCALCGIALVGAFVKVDTVIRNGSVRYIDSLEMDEPVLREILTVAEGKVYVHGIPQIYRNRFEGISSSIFDGDELARCYDTTVLMDRNYDSSCFINSGFLFMPVSESRALYTNDMSVIRGMEKKGYHLTGYYNVEKEANLEALRHDNGLVYNEEGLYLEGPEHSLIHGPYVSLHSGEFSVWYDLHMDMDLLKSLREQGDKEESQEEYTVVEGTQGDVLLGTAKICAYYGQQVIKEQGIYLSDFDDEGGASVEVSFSTGNYPGMEFLIILQNGIGMTLNSMRYARTPQYDVHAFYNRNRLKYRDEFYSLEGKKEERPEGYFAAEYEYNYDRAVIEIRYYNTDNEPALIKAGYSQVKRGLDEKNRVIREEYYGTDGKRILLPQGYSANEREYDEEGNAIVQRYYDSEDKPVLTTWGYAEIHREFDYEHRVIREAYFDTEGKPLNMPQGYAVNEREYDEAGNVIVQRYADMSGIPVMTTWNYAEIHREFNIKKQVVKESYYDTEGNLKALPSGQAEVRREYNEMNQLVRESYFGVNGQPVNLSQGYAVNERGYDDNGNVIVQKYCDTSGTLVMTTWNYAEIHRTFDEERRVVTESYFNAEGKLMALPSGQAEVHREYNDNNQIIRESYFGVDGQPVNLPQGYAVNEREYDSNGNAIVQRYCDAFGKPVMTTWNYAEIHRVFDEERRVVADSYYDVEGKPLALPSGQAEVHRKYNDKNQVICEAYFGVDGKPVNMAQGYAVIEREYDEAGNVSIQKFCDASGKPVMTTWNYAEIHREFNEKKQIILEMYYGTESRLITLPTGQAGEKRDYDEAGRLTIITYLGLDGNPINLPTGQAREEREYDDTGKLLIQRYYDLNGKPVMLTGEFASTRREYDENGQQVRLIYYDLEGQEVEPK